jgi:proteic killer suppression protein
MIRSFKDKESEKLWNGEGTRKIPFNIHKVALRKLFLLRAAKKVEDLMIPPGNKLEKLKGNRAGQYSIRINQKYRICFKFDTDAYDVEIIDYH